MASEYIPANNKILLIFLVSMAAYLVFRFNIEHIADYLISYDYYLVEKDIFLAERQEKFKLIVQAVLLAVPIIAFFILIGWVGYMIVRTRTIPPKSIYFPFGMKRLYGKEALFIGYMCLIVSSAQIIASLYRVYEAMKLVDFTSV